MQLPTIPSFFTGDTSVRHLQQLGQAVQFATLGAPYVPMWRFFRTATLSVSGSTYTQVPMTSIAVDSEGIWTSPGIATILTQGYYECEACMPFEGNAATYTPATMFRWTAGPINAHYSAGTTQYFGGASWASLNNSAPDAVQCISDKCPVVCYPGDTIAVYVLSSLATTINIEQNNLATAGWFPPTFSGRWVREGS